MKKLILVVLLSVFAFNAFAEDQQYVPLSDSVILSLQKKLEERDLTIRELEALNLSLLVENIGLQDANVKLRQALINRTRSFSELQKKYSNLASKKVAEVQKDSIKEIRSILKNLDQRLSQF